MNHPCDRYSCPEWNQGQCFGGGCRANPARREERDEDCEDNCEDNGEDEQ